MIEQAVAEDNVVALAVVCRWRVEVKQLARDVRIALVALTQDIEIVSASFCAVYAAVAIEEKRSEIADAGADFEYAPVVEVQPQAREVLKSTRSVAQVAVGVKIALRCPRDRG